MPEASAALLAGDAQRHDELLLSAIGSLRRQPLDAIVLGQASMARVLDRVAGAPGPLVLSSLPLSLEAVRAAMGEAAGAREP
ncbi:MAG: hypothetical protein ACP5U2_13290 [Bryobacteraceae bacterium]